MLLNNQSIGVPFGGVRFSHMLSDFGTSGCATGQFKFDVYDESGIYGRALLEDVPVKLVEKNSQTLPSRTYYISKRSISKNICHFVAYDVMSRVEQDFVGNFTDDEIPCGNVLEAIKIQCGFTSVGTSGGGTEYIKFTRDQLTDKTVRGVLDMISTALCGTWLATQDDGIVLSCFGQPYDDIAHYSKYSEIDYQGRQKITKLICTNTETGKVNEMSTGEYGTVITINSPFVAAGTPLDGVVWGRLQNYVYQAWRCDKAILDGFIPASSRFYFGDFGDDTAMLLANNVTIDVDSTGLYFSGGADPQDEEQWRYDDYTQRQLNKKLELDERNGNMALTKEGMKIFTNYNESADNRKKSTVIRAFKSEV